MSWTNFRQNVEIGFQENSPRIGIENIFIL